jgi:hypothetical protein
MRPNHQIDLDTRFLMKLSAAHDSSGSEHPDVRGQIDEEEVRMPSSTPPRL